MPTIKRLINLEYQYRKPAKNLIDATWKPIEYIEAAQSTLNALVPDTTTYIEEDKMPTIFLETILDWSAEGNNNTIVKIEKEYAYVIQNLTEKNIAKRQYILTPNLGIGYFDISYYGGIL